MANNFDQNVQRDGNRIDTTGEVFTPTELVEEILGLIDIDKDYKCLDPTCGNGQFLVGVMSQLMKQYNLTKKEIVEGNIYGVDLMLDNVKLCIYRLCVDSNAETIPGYEENFSLAPESVINPHNWKHNICCADGLKYDYSFIRFESHVHQEYSKSEDGNFYLPYLKLAPVDSLFDWGE